ncbi:MAG TPA: AMP-binding protein, partial [Acidimicrobiales bacterium]
MSPADSAVPDSSTDGGPPADTIAHGVLARAEDPGLGLWAGGLGMSHAEVVAAAAARGAWLRAARGATPFHVAVLLDNVPEFVFWLEAAALVGAVVVGANPTHRGDELVRDLTHTECQFLVTDSASLPLLDGARVGSGLGVVDADNPRVFVADTPAAPTALAPFEGATATDVVDRSVT